MTRSHRTALLATVFLPLMVVTFWLVKVPLAQAQLASQEEPTRTPIPNLSLSDDYCLECHGQPGQTYPLQNGDLLDLYVPPELHRNSVHGQMGYACVQCHRQVGEYPHPPFQAADRRDATLQLNAVCQHCHSHQYEQAQDSVHALALAAGQRQAAVCVDCHTAHEVRRLNDPQTRRLLPDAHIWVPERCALCHNAIYQKYLTSVHGSALTQGNLDVPTCIDCHGVHNIEDPRTNYFRLRSPSICAHCHTNPQIMSKYGLSTEVLNTYVSDFHGTTTVIFERLAPDAPVNTPVCTDCHGIHDIVSTRDPESGLQMRGNLLARCQVCHPDADVNFPAAWMSHYIPSRERYSIVYFVNLFYQVFIPLTLGGMGLLVTMDLTRRLINRRRQRLAERQALLVEAPIPEEAIEIPALEASEETPALTTEEPSPLPAGDEPETLAVPVPPSEAQELLPTPSATPATEEPPPTSTPVPPSAEASEVEVAPPPDEPAEESPTSSEEESPSPDSKEAENG